MHDVPGEPHWHEPIAGQRAGLGEFRRPQMPYDRFMELEDIPVYRGIGVLRVQDLPTAPWARLGGRGSYIQLHGTEGLLGQYIVEIPALGALNTERHLYEKIVLVVEGRGTTEVWLDGQTKPNAFEWQRGSLFAIPLNAIHRFVNASSAPALLLCGTTAPNAMNLFDNLEFIFDCQHNFPERFSGSSDYFMPGEGIEPDPVRGLAMWRTNFIPDASRCALPLDNRRSPGFRRIEPFMGRNRFYLSIAEHAAGRYAMAHRSRSAAVLVCLKGKGYSYAWPAAYGATPWREGQGDKVLRQDYEPVGLVSTAPGAGQWFHQEFGVGTGSLRLSAWHGANNQSALKPGRPGEIVIERGAAEIGAGAAISYEREDSYVRAAFEQELNAVRERLRIIPKLH